MTAKKAAALGKQAFRSKALRAVGAQLFVDFDASPSRSVPRESVDEGRASMNRPSTRVLVLLIGIAVVAAIGATTSRNASAVLPPLPNTVQQWNKIAEDTVVGSGAFQGEGEVYMSYTAAAVYDAVVAIQGGYEPYGAAITAPAGASVD
jgi:hypothetical protein